MKKLLFLISAMFLPLLFLAQQHNYTPPDSPGPLAYYNNTYIEEDWTAIEVTQTDVVTDVVIAYTWITDDWADEGSFHLKSPAGTTVEVGSEEFNGGYNKTLSDFSGENMEGTWILWIEDWYGDGGHQATDISIGFKYDTSPTNPNPADAAAGIAINGNLTWDFGADTETYDLWFGEAGNMTEVVTAGVAGTTGSYSYTGLANFTEYQWQVIAYNNEGSVSGSIWSFTTTPMVQIGSGTSIYQHLPIEPYYGYDYTQSIYLSSSFSGVGADKRIEKLYYNYTKASSDNTNEDDWHIWIGTTANTNLDGGYVDVTTLTDVFNGSVGFGALPAGSGWLEITLTTPFNYNPDTDGNLIIAVHEYNSGYNLGYHDFYCDQDVRANISRYTYSDGNNPDPANPPAGTASAFYPNTRFLFGYVACPAPTALTTTAITANTANLGWTESGTATTWNIKYGAPGFNVATEGTLVSGVTDNPYTLVGLTAITTYDWYVQTVCGGEDESSWAGPNTFTTLTDAHPFPLAENFESGFANFANAAGNTVDWVMNTDIFHGGSQAAHNAYGASNVNILHETGKLDLSGTTAATLEFWHIAKTEGGFENVMLRYQQMEVSPIMLCLRRAIKVLRQDMLLPDILMKMIMKTGEHIHKFQIIPGGEKKFLAWLHTTQPM